MKYLRDFIIGSSIVVVAPFYYAVHNSQIDKPYSYYQYTFLAPLAFGFWNVISLIIAEKFGISKKLRFLLISLITYLAIIFFVYYFNVYKLTSNEWIKYFIYQFLRYMIVWNIIIFYLDKYV